MGHGGLEALAAALLRGRRRRTTWMCICERQADRSCVRDKHDGRWRRRVGWGRRMRGNTCRESIVPFLLAPKGCPSSGAVCRHRAELIKDGVETTAARLILVQRERTRGVANFVRVMCHAESSKGLPHICTKQITHWQQALELQHRHIKTPKEMAANGCFVIPALPIITPVALPTVWHPGWQLAGDMAGHNVAIAPTLSAHIPRRLPRALTQWRR